MCKYKKALILIPLLLQVGSTELKVSDLRTEVPWARQWGRRDSPWPGVRDHTPSAFSGEDRLEDHNQGGRNPLPRSWGWSHQLFLRSQSSPESIWTVPLVVSCKFKQLCSTNYLNELEAKLMRQKSLAAI